MMRTRTKTLRNTKLTIDRTVLRQLTRSDLVEIVGGIGKQTEVLRGCTITCVADTADIPTACANE